VRQWWTQGDVLEGLSAVHAADEELTAARRTSDLLARVPILRADLTRLLGEEDPRRRDVLRLLDRLADEADEPTATAAVEGLREQHDEEPDAAAEPGADIRVKVRSDEPVGAEQQRGAAEGEDEPGGDLPWRA
jgi:hypothetical protein